MKNFLRKFFLSVLGFIVISNPIYSQSLVVKQGMVVSEQALASQVGLDILKQGGNAIDAAVAIGYALAVVSPCCGNLGGGGFMTIHLANGKNIFINFREKAPLAATEKMFQNTKGHNKSTYGYLAVATPGTVLGLDTVLKKYGTFSRQQVIAPAIQLAEKGFVLGPGDVKILQMDKNLFQTQPNVAAIFLKHNKPYQMGDILIQKNLAQTLKLLSAKGSQAFYRGKIAKTIVQSSEKNGGILTLKDFKEYTVQELKPIQCSYHGFTLISSPPPSSGGTSLCQMLNILEGYPLERDGQHSVENIHYIVEAMRLAYADRNNLLGDPDFVNNPVTYLISKNYAEKQRLLIPNSRALSSAALLKKAPQTEGDNTTHFSVIDKWNNAVAVTYTINNFFGAHVIAGDTGFFLNSEMDDFAIHPGAKNQFGLVQGEKNKIQPGKRPLSSMTPTIVMKDNKVVMVLGTSGGPRITTAVLLTIINVIDYQKNIQEAVSAPRFHHQGFPDLIDMEPNAFPEDIIKKLSKEGYYFRPHAKWGAVEAIYIDPVTGVISGANDPRRAAGKALGY